MEVRLPKIMGRETEAMLTKWHAADGDHVEKGTLLYEVEVPKLTTSKVAPATGCFYKRVEEGIYVKYDQLLAVIEEDE